MSRFVCTWLKSLVAFFVAAVSLPALAGGGGGLQIVSWYAVIAEHLREIFGIGLETAVLKELVSSAGAFIVVTVVGLAAGFYRLKPTAMSDDDLLPPKSFGVKAFVELCWAVIGSTLEKIVGDKAWTHYATLLGGTFFFIICANLSGLVPGFPPATEYISQNAAMALIIFLAFNYVGLKHGGWNYIKHLCGPVLLLAPLMFSIELIALLARPVSLSLRLYGNVSGDHMVFNVFSTLMRDFHVPFLPVPGALLTFGLLVACLQAFIFMTLSSVYVRLSLDTAHHDH
ncbi:MAG: F0F1 ATP synthase subunit A [Betaproteobacteria bacterium]|nr:F0F1 ATP synthase subunit A [Betaproteobacteria bacterium]